MSTGVIETKLRLLFSSHDVTEDVLPDLLSMTFAEKETNEADEIGILLKDPQGKWAGSWSPKGGESIRAYIINHRREELYCGRFFVDSLRVAGSPRTFEMRAVSIPLNKPIRRKLKTRAWEAVTLKSIAEALAKEAGLALLFESTEDPDYDRQDQTNESDLKFLLRLCEDAGLSVKVTDEQLVIFDQSYYEKFDAIDTITLGESAILSWDFENVQSQTYRSCTVSYRDPKKKKPNEAGSFNFALEKEDMDTEPGYDINLNRIDKKGVNHAVQSWTYVDETVDENGQDYVVKKRAKSIEEAKRLAKAKLRSLNLRRITGNMTLLGNVRYRAGVVISCKGFGSFDGNFYIEEATHNISSRGYTTTVRIRRVNNQY